MINEQVNVVGHARVIEGHAMLVSIAEAAQISGLSSIYIRRGCQSGTIPHIKSGVKYSANITKLLEMIDDQSAR